MRIIGIDPGLNRTGYGIVDMLNKGSGGQIAVEGGFCSSNPKDSLELRIQAIYSDVFGILGEFQPEVMAMEELHSRYEYPKTAIVMGHVRGAVCLAAAQTGIPVVGYTATRVKNALTGSGASPKKQVQRAVAAQLKLADIPSPNDVADAFALAICHAMSANRVIAAFDQCH